MRKIDRKKSLKDLDDGLGDWRFDTVTTIVHTVGPYRAGDAVRLMSTGGTRRHRYLSFVTPSVSALCLNAAIDSASRAEGIRPRIRLTESRSPQGVRGFMVMNENHGDLYYFYEETIIALTMSFQALEAFANAMVGRLAKGTVQIARKGGVTESYTPAEAERMLSTEDKLSQVLPSLFHVASPKGQNIWNRFKELKRLRDETVHIKSGSMYTKNHQTRSTTLLFEFLDSDVRSYPDAALRVMSHYFPQSPEPRWLTHARAKAKDDSRSHVAVKGAL